jgi:HK97 family phage portal protein
MLFRKDSLLDRLSSAFTGRQERSLAMPNQWVYSGYGVPPTYDQQAALDAYGNNVWVYGGVSKVASEIARTPFKLRTKGDQPEEVTSHQVLEVLETPHPLPSGKSMLTTFDLKYITALHLLLPGEGFWVLQDRLGPKLGGAPTRIDIALPHYMRPRLDDNADLADYRYLTAKGEITIPPENVVHFKLPDPGNPYRGHSPMQAARYAIGSHQEADLLNLKMLQNGGLPQGFLTTEGNLSADQMALFREQWRQLYGGGRNAGKVAVLPNKMGFQELQRSQQDLQYAEGKKVNGEEILAALGIGPEVLGKTDNQTRANADAAIYVFEKFGVTPFLDKIIDTLNNDLLPQFPGTEDLEFYYDDRIPENADEKRQTAETLFQSAALTPDEIRQMFGLDPLNIPGVTDVPYVPFQMTIAGDSKPAPNLPTDASAA